MLEKGIKAPDFTLPDKNGNLISLSDFLGKKLFYIFTQRTTLLVVQSKPVLLPLTLKSSKKLMRL